eukprot:TRINITY_DN26052_c0_g1_i1.p1 TRINITY_DN26052_c0_g1~~TRINITY_DN26052_c0_g1_i1.p1  ORF type:complete len:320 (-),score=41.76 TRINITY_DN26052_c0_g1_i1:45-1004(-)
MALLDLSCLKAGEVEWPTLHRTLALKLAKACIYVKPLLVGWYNDHRKRTTNGTQLLDAPEDALAFLLYSGPGYIDTIVEHFIHSARNESCHYVDATTDALLEGLLREFPENLGAHAVNLDKGPPYFHAQTLGVVAGAGQHLDPSEIDDLEWHESISKQLLELRSPEVWGTDVTVRQKLFGISLHPEFGGWYAYRGLLILHGARASSLVRPPCVVAVADLAEKKRIIAEYNLRGDDCRWRDLTHTGHAPDKRYTPEEMIFFTEMNLGRRKRLLEMKADIMKSLADSSSIAPEQPTFSKQNISEHWGANSALVDSLHQSSS